MDKSWITAPRTGDEYANGVTQFLEFAKANASNTDGKFRCPCKKCGNFMMLSVTEIEDHLYWNGFLEFYTTWIWHGEEKLSSSSNVDDNKQVCDDDDGVDDRLHDMFCDVADDFTDQPRQFDTILTDLEKPLWPGCPNKYTRLSAVLALFNLKAANGWSDKSFTSLLHILKNMLPEDNELPNTTYEAKKILCPLGMGYKKFHACPNDCVLFRNEFNELNACPTCGASRYKTTENVDSNVLTKGSPAKVLWYLPIIPRFKRLFANPIDAKHLTWHSSGRTVDGNLRHPADSPQWKTIDVSFPTFGLETRNLRLGLCTDGINPHGDMSSKHSSWPVMLVIYNLPPWLCMKRKYIMLSLMISGPKQPGNDIDIFLAPLIDDLKKLWDEGVSVFDGYKKEYFTLRAMIFCTINDFPAYGNLSGYSVKGHKACPICERATCFKQLVHGKKTVYLGHRKFLDRFHPYRKLKKAFNGLQEFDDAPRPLTGGEVYEKVKNINLVFGKTQKKISQTEKSPWKKMSIFFELPYWKVLDVRHCIDVMHVEKNVCDSLVGTLLNIKSKTKDGLNSRLDLIEMGIRPNLAPKPTGKKSYLPPATHTLSKKERTSLCQCLRGVKVPQWYSSNIKTLVNMKELKLVGLKSHDCHALMQQLLPVAIRDILPKNVRHTITRLCFFFNAICAKVIDPRTLDELEKGITITLCQLEMYFPPSFFDIMVHLVVHLVREIKSCGPPYLRWMYPLERYMKVLKGYVRNRFRPEASIVESYIAEEVVEFCTDYLNRVESIGLPKSRLEERIDGVGTRGARVVTKAHADIQEAHLYVLRNMSEVEPYFEEHMDLVRRQNPKKSHMWVVSEHNRSFISWFKNKILTDNNITGDIRFLARGPSMEVICHGGFDCNGFSFYTKSQDDLSTRQNSGVSLVASAMHFSSSKDKNPILAQMSYFGVIEEIWSIDYSKFRVPVFRCRWVDSKHGVKVDDLGFTLVDLSREGHKDERFIMTSQAKQVFYVTDPCDKRWSIVLHGKRQMILEGNEDASFDVEEIPPFSSNLLSVNIESEVDEVHAARNDHQEGLWEEGLWEE